MSSDSPGERVDPPPPGVDPEEWCRAAGYRLLAGVDEAGRGPLAGPVVAAAVILPVGVALTGLRDSKKLSPRQRDALEPRIQGQALEFAVAVVDVASIEARGIFQASLAAMAEAVQALNREPDAVLVDGPWMLPLARPQCPLVGGDDRCRCIAAAAVLAKVHRDRMMLAYHHLYPHYNFAGHKGYATAEHLAAIRRHGPCPIHRRTFKGVKEFL